DGKTQVVSTGAMGTIAYDPRTGREIWKVQHGGMNSATPPLHGHGLVYVTTAAGGLGLAALRPTGTGDVSKTHGAWSPRKSVPSRPAPLLLGDRLFMVDDNGQASVLDARTSKSLWVGRLGAKTTASPVFGDGKVYVFDETGKGHVIEMGATPRV